MSCALLTDRPFLDACAFAARAHHGQLRKDGRTPYVSHAFRVCLVVREIFGIDDPRALAAALLHDTIEDTTTDFDDIEKRFGQEIASWVAALSKDKRLPEKKREHDYLERLRKAPWPVKICKLADVFDNLLDSDTTDAHQQSRTFKNAHLYLDALDHDLAERHRAAWQTVSKLLAAMECRETGGAGGA
jgi:guanosine-3',5'-bis(diphosphate) 3'-pyrophosphohydrolase